jgi:MFS family permease
MVADVALPKERAGFFGILTIGPMVGPTIGPIIGGGLADKLGWRAIFWFMCIASGTCALLMVLFLPETLRSIVGNGSITPRPFLRPLVPIVGRNLPPSVISSEKAQQRAAVNPFKLLTYIDVDIILFFNGIIYAVFYAVTASTSTLFKEAYPHLTETDLGLAYIPMGVGMIIGSFSTGRLLDREYKALRRKYDERKARDKENQQKLENQGDTEDDFRIELARMRTMPIFLFLYIATLLGYGWALEKKVNMSVPLILQFIREFIQNLIVINEFDELTPC